MATPPRAPTADHLGVYRDVLERVLFSLRKLPPRIDRGPLQRAVEAALATVTRLSQSEATLDDHRALLDELAARVVEARAALSSIEGNRDAATGGARSLRQIEASVRGYKERTVDVIVADQHRPLRRPAP